MDCKYCQEEICVNADCPMFCDVCPFVDVHVVCRFEEREERNEQSCKKGSGQLDWSE